MNRRDCGFILPMTIVTLTLLALAALMTGRAVGAMLRASVQERLTIAEQQTTRTAEAVLDAWMADKHISLQITDPSQPHHALILDRDAWRTSEGEQPCPTAKETSCWRILLPPPPLTPTTTVKLRGGEAERRIREVTIETRSGCFSSIDNCQRTHTVTREYERAVFAQYQLHFNNHDAPQRAIDHASDSLTAAEAAAREAGTLVAADADVIEWTSRVTLLQGARIVFADGDTFDGPVRTGLNRVLICGSPIFHKPVEVSLPEGTDTTNETGIVVQAPGCTSLSLPNWQGQRSGERVVAGRQPRSPSRRCVPPQRSRAGSRRWTTTTQMTATIRCLATARAEAGSSPTATSSHLLRGTETSRSPSSSWKAPLPSTHPATSSYKATSKQPAPTQRADRMSSRSSRAATSSSIPAIPTTRLPCAPQTFRFHA